MDELKIDTEFVRNKITAFIREEARKCGFHKAVVGVSGGVDSATVATLAKDALGEENVLGLILPYKETSQEDIKGAQSHLKKIKLNSKLIDITPLVDAYFKDLSKADHVRRGNFMARMRMSILFDQSKDFEAVVLGCGNKTEILLGYFTLYGDGAAAMHPMGDLYKTQVFQLAEALGVPKKIIDKPPSAGLWPGQTDEGELGFRYKDVDRLLFYLIDSPTSEKDLQIKGFSPEFINKVKSQIKKTEFKRRLPLIAELT